MLTLFKNKRLLAAAPTVSSTSHSKGLIRPESGAVLLATPRRQKLMEYIWQRTSVSRAQFAALYYKPLERYAELVQQFPASESHHHAYLGGMLDHGLEIMAYALKLRQTHLLPIGAAPEIQAAQAEAWTAAIAHAALLHDIGKIAVDLHVEYANGHRWHPWHGPLQRPYQFRYRPNREYHLHSAATGLLYTRLLDRELLDWLSDFPELWSALLYVLAGHYAQAGLLGELIIQADQASVTQSLGGNPSKALTAPKHALQRKLLEGLRHLITAECKLNQAEASDGWLTADALWLVSKTTCDKLRAHLLSHGMDGIPENNTALFNVLQEHKLIVAAPNGKAIWKATVTSVNGWSHSFTFLRMMPAAIWENMERPPPFSGSIQIENESGTDGNETAKTAEIVNNPEAEVATTFPPIPDWSSHSVSPLNNDTDKFAPENATEVTVQNSATLGKDIAPPSKAGSPDTDTSSAPRAALSDRFDGEHFMTWLRQGIQSRRIIMNEAKALVHTVADTVYLISPGIFQRYAREYPAIASLAKQNNMADWGWVQKRFEQLRAHRKQSNGLNIWTCDVSGPRKTRRIHGYLLNDPILLLSEIPFNNPYLALESPLETPLKT